MVGLHVVEMEHEDVRLVPVRPPALDKAVEEDIEEASWWRWDTGCRAERKRLLVEPILEGNVVRPNKSRLYHSSVEVIPQLLPVAFQERQERNHCLFRVPEHDDVLEILSVREERRASRKWRGGVRLECTCEKGKENERMKEKWMASSGNCARASA